MNKVAKIVAGSQVGIVGVELLKAVVVKPVISLE